MGKEEQITHAQAMYSLLLADAMELARTKKELSSLQFRLKKIAVQQRLVKVWKRPYKPYAFHVTATRSGAFKWTFRYTDETNTRLYFHGVGETFSDCLAALFYSMEEKKGRPDKLPRG